MKIEYSLLGAIFLTLQFLLVYSCSSKEEIDAKTIDRIVFYAIPKGVEFVHRIDSFSQLQFEGRDTVIADRCFINCFVNEINQLVPSNHPFQVDLRS